MPAPDRRGRAIRAFPHAPPSHPGTPVPLRSSVLTRWSSTAQRVQARIALAIDRSPTKPASSTKTLSSRKSFHVPATWSQTRFSPSRSPTRQAVFEAHRKVCFVFRPALFRSVSLHTPIAPARCSLLAHVVLNFRLSFLVQPAPCQFYQHPVRGRDTNRKGNHKLSSSRTPFEARKFGSPSPPLPSPPLPSPPLPSSSFKSFKSQGRLDRPRDPHGGREENSDGRNSTL